MDSKVKVTLESDYIENIVSKALKALRICFAGEQYIYTILKNLLLNLC